MMERLYEGTSPVNGVIWEKQKTLNTEHITKNNEQKTRSPESGANRDGDPAQLAG